MKPPMNTDKTDKFNPLCAIRVHRFSQQFSVWQKRTRMKQIKRVDADKKAKNPRQSAVSAKSAFYFCFVWQRVFSN
jgi:hypothetical protein